MTQLKSLSLAGSAIVFPLLCAGCGGGGNGAAAVTASLPESVLYSFGPPLHGDGNGPTSALIQGSDGALYGTTSSGGANGLGTVFRISTAGVETILHSFGPAGAGDAIDTITAVVQASDGNLYGTSALGGTNNTGAIFKVTPSGAEVVLYSFGPATSTDGQSPSSSLIQASDGNLYGVTSAGGVNGTGTVYRVTLAGAETVMHSFGPSSGTDGQSPIIAATLLQATDGSLYGVTTYGGANGTGTIFRITLAGLETVVYSFGAASGTDGRAPASGLIQATDGNLYGTTGVGGTNNSGTVFQVSTGGAETVIHSFGAIGSGEALFPNGVIQASDGSIMGTSSGGSGAQGAVFKLSVSGEQLALHSFGGIGDGAHPSANLLQASDGHLYGTTMFGGTHATGTVFRLP